MNDKLISYRPLFIWSCITVQSSRIRYPPPTGTNMAIAASAARSCRLFLCFIKFPPFHRLYGENNQKSLLYYTPLPSTLSILSYVNAFLLALYFQQGLIKPFHSAGGKERCAKFRRAGRPLPHGSFPRKKQPIQSCFLLSVVTALRERRPRRGRPRRSAG